MRVKRAVYVALGVVSAGIGLVATVIPGLPTTVFLLIAAWFFTRSSPRLETWLREHRVVGPYLSAWETDRAVPRSAKVVAGVSMAVAVVAVWVVIDPHALVLLALAATLAVVFAWIVRRPEPLTLGSLSQE